MTDLNQTIDIQGLRAGPYLVRVRRDDAIYTKKFIVDSN